MFWEPYIATASLHDLSMQMQMQWQNSPNEPSNHEVFLTSWLGNSTECRTILHQAKIQGHTMIQSTCSSIKIFNEVIIIIIVAFLKFNKIHSKLVGKLLSVFHRDWELPPLHQHYIVSVSTRFKSFQSILRCPLLYQTRVDKRNAGRPLC